MYLVVPPGGSFLETRRIELGPTALTIGRAESCEIRVDIPGVDQEHAKISEVALIALGPDCAIGDVPLDAGSRRLLMPGDEIQIGSVVVALEGDDPSIAPPPPRLNATDPMPHARPMEAPRVRVVEGPNFGDELLLKEEGREYVVGRGAKCDLALDDREVSREHVKVMRKGYVIYVMDLSSTRGSWLGRAAVYTGATVEWSRPRMLRVGATVLSLELPEAIRRAVPGAQPSAPMTPPPRSRNNVAAGLAPTPSAPGVAMPHGAGSDGVPNSAPGVPSGPPSGTQKLVTYPYTPATPPASPAPLPAPYTPPQQTMPLPAHPFPGAGVPHAMTPPPGPAMMAPAGAMPFAGGPMGHEAMAPQGRSGHLTTPGPTRKAWKKSGPTIGKASGLLLLALAGLVILGGLFVVFSLLE